MGKWGWLFLGAAAGAAGMWVFDHRNTLEAVYQHRDQISAAGDIAGGLDSAWEGFKKLVGGGS